MATVLVSKNFKGIVVRYGSRNTRSQLVRLSPDSKFLSDRSRQVTATTTELQEEEEPENTSSVNKTGAYLQLAKAKLSALVVATTGAGFIAAGGPLYDQAALASCCVIGTALCSSSAAAWNQILERDRDSQMKRTQQRPLVQGDLTVKEATLAATIWGAAGTSILALGTDPSPLS